MKLYKISMDTLMTNLLALLIMFTCSAATFAQCEAAQLMADDGGGGNDFARSVSIDGDIAVVGDGVIEKVYIYRRGDAGPGDWNLEQVLTSPIPPAMQFGWRVLVQNDVIVVGAPTASAPEFNQGAAFIYQYDASIQKWGLVQQLFTSDGEGGDEFGFSVAIDRDVVLIGARNDTVDGKSDAGSAYIFRYDNQLKQWIEEAKLIDPAGKQNDLLAFSLTVEDGVALIGKPADDNVANQAGKVFVFRFDGLKWNLEAELLASDGAACALFGWSIDLSGTTALIGAKNSDGQNGSAYIFIYDGKEWTEQIKLSGSDPIGVAPSFGTSLALSSDATTAIIGAQGDNAQGFHSGAVYLFRNEGSGWTEIEKLLVSDGSPADILGTSVAISGSIGLLGAPRPSEFPGTAYVFELDPPLGDLDCDGQISLHDLVALLNSWGPCSNCEVPGDCTADLDGNCVVNTNDLLILFGNWG